MKTTHKATILLLAIGGMAGLSASGQNLLLNGSFESPSLPPNTLSPTVPASWLGNGAYVGMINGAYGSAYPFPQVGQQYAALGNASSLSQVFTIIAAGRYALTWFDSSEYNGPSQQSPYSVVMTDGSGHTVTNANFDANASGLRIWASRSMALTLAPGSYTLRILGNVGVYGERSLIDNVSLMPSFAVDPTSFSDDFEGASLNAFWSLRQVNGTITFPSTAQVHSGSQAVQFTSGPGHGQRNIELHHTFARPQYGTVTVWVYDGDNGHYTQLSFENRASGTGAQIGTQDWESIGTGHYFFLSRTPTEQVNSPSSVVRTRGWHKWSISAMPDSTTFSIDGQVVYRGAGRNSFDFVRLDMHGPSSGAFDTYYDDFSFVAAPKLNVYVSEVGLCWDTAPNTVYQVRYRDALGTNGWLPLGVPILGTGARYCTNDVLPPDAARRFYQVIINQTP